MPTTGSSRQGNFGLTRKENAIEYATLGNTGLLVSKLSLPALPYVRVVRSSRSGCKQRLRVAVNDRLGIEPG